MSALRRSLLVSFTLLLWSWRLVYNHVTGYSSSQRSFHHPVTTGRTTRLFSAPDIDAMLQNATRTPQEIAEDLRARSRALMAEARAMEAALRDAKRQKNRKVGMDADAMIDHLFSNSNQTSEELAELLQRERWSQDQLTTVVNRLHKRQLDAIGSAPPGDFQIGNVRNSMANTTEGDRLDCYLQTLIEAASLVDTYVNEKRNQGASKDLDKTFRWSGRVGSSLQSVLKELRRAEDADFRRRLASQLNTVFANPSTNESVLQFSEATLSGPSDARQVNISKVVEQVAFVPLWVPSTLIDFMVACREKLEKADVRMVKDQVLSGSHFYCTSSDTFMNAAIFRGNIRSPAGTVENVVDRNHTAIVFQEIQNRMEHAGLSKRLQLFFALDPEWRAGGEDPEPRPVLLAFPKSMTPSIAKRNLSISNIIKRSAIAITLASTFAYSVACYSLNPLFFDSIVMKHDISVLVACIPLFLGVIGLQVLHELAHIVVARARGIRIGFPTPIPSPQVGSFGCITPLKSFPENRTALFDFSLSGPVVTAAASIGLMICGIFLTVRAPETALSRFPVVPVGLFKSSFLTGSLLSCFAPKLMLLPTPQPIPIHPTVLVGFAGLVSSALNLLPIFRLDGGRACTAMFGSRLNAVISMFTLLPMLTSVFSESPGITFVWGLVVAMFQRRIEIPVRDEVTPVDNFRLGAFVVSMVTAALTVLPFPGGPRL